MDDDDDDDDVMIGRQRMKHNDVTKSRACER